MRRSKVEAGVKVKTVVNILHGSISKTKAASDKDGAWVRDFDKKSYVAIDAGIITLKTTDLNPESVWICLYNPTVLINTIKAYCSKYCSTPFSIPKIFVTIPSYIYQNIRFPM